ncbi:MAG: hypothetical protein IT435_19330 [Phycisphaerales bacterium]|nr:hypothetical protein [Phycisphaerales bacterium]
MTVATKDRVFIPILLPWRLLLNGRSELPWRGINLSSRERTVVGDGFGARKKISLILQERSCGK